MGKQQNRTVGAGSTEPEAFTITSGEQTKQQFKSTELDEFF